MQKFIKDGCNISPKKEESSQLIHEITGIWNNIIYIDNIKVIDFA
jgi:hypothetical protein